MAIYQAGDGSAFERLYERFAPAVITYLDVIEPGLGRDATLLSEVFLAIHRARRSYDPRRSFAPWAGAIAEHVVLSLYPACRSRRRLVTRRRPAVPAAKDTP